VEVFLEHGVWVSACDAVRQSYPPGVGLGENAGVPGTGINGVKVGRGVGVFVGVGDTYQREVAVGVRVGGMTGEGVISISGG
jgi:hypothetical protein